MRKKKYTQEGPTLFDNICDEAIQRFPETLEKLEDNGFTKEMTNLISKESALIKERAPVDNVKIIIKLRDNAASLLRQAEKINTSVNGNWTYRRQRFADNAQLKKDALVKGATVLNRLADLWEENRCPEILRGIRSRGDFDAYYPMPPDASHGKWYHENYPILLKKATRLGLKSKEDTTLFQEYIKNLSLVEYSPEDKNKRELKEKLKEVHRMNIPGFFPTPDDVIDTMLEYASIEDGMTVLEPSAGIGNIVDRIVSSGYSYHITCVERHHSLAEILRLKGYPCHCCDIFEYEPPKGESGIPYGFDRIVMNPPFEKGQDIEHVRHCYDTFLKKGGTLVSVMSAGVMSNSTKKYVEFREWVEKKAGVFIDLGQAFKNSFNSTSVSVVILMIEK
jgi:hypothetical protein